MGKPGKLVSGVLLGTVLFAAADGLGAERLRAQDRAGRPDASDVATVEVIPATAEAEVGQELAFKAVVRDVAGKEPVDKAVRWFAIPSDLAAADQSGTLTVYGPGTVQIAALVEGKAGFATVTVRPARVVRVEIEPAAGALVVGGAFKLEAEARAANGDPRKDVLISWSSETPSVASVDAAGVVTGVAPGKATLRAGVEGAVGTLAIEVVENPVRRLAVEPRMASVRTGDVVRFTVQAGGRGGTAVESPFVRWSVGGEGAMIEPDGAFVAERPGTYAVTATSGANVASASVVVQARKVERAIEVLGRGPVTELQAAEQWIVGKHAYLGSVGDRVWVYDISDPSKPVKTDSLVVDARIVNDVSTTAGGTIGVLTREGASSRKNGLVFFDASDPAHPKAVAEYTETVTGGVHSAFIDGHYVYATDDATGSLRVIDFADLRSPKEVARWEIEKPLARTFVVEGETFSGGRYLHDVYVKDGLAYLAYWKDGLVILDVGNGMRGGSPEKPQFVSQLRFNHHELYGPGWFSGTHTVFRYKDYVFVGDEVLPSQFDILSKDRIVTRGILHVVDVSNVQQPRKVAEYSVPEAGAHNVWVADDVLYMGFTYGGGGRILDVSGELRGDLYAQGREIARIWTGDSEGYRPNLPATWGAQPHGDLIFFNDINSGLWITRLGEPRERGSTTAPGD